MSTEGFQRKPLFLISLLIQKSLKTVEGLHRAELVGASAVPDELMDNELLLRVGLGRVSKRREKDGGPQWVATPNDNLICLLSNPRCRRCDALQCRGGDPRRQ